MSVRISIQKKIHEHIMAGTFPAVSYDDSHLPVEGASESPKSVYVNETNGGLADSQAYGATSTDFVIRDWRFEAVAEFSNEVDTSYFLLNELKTTFNVDNLMVNVVPSGDFQVVHPPRNASHNGTKLTIGLTVNTRR